MLIIIWYFVCAISIFLTITLAIKKKLLPLDKEEQALWIVSGFFVAIIASVDYLPKFGFEIYPFGCFFILTWALITFYAILRHKILNIEFAIEHSVIYSILIAAVSLIYLLIVVGLERVVGHSCGYRSTAISIATAFLIGLLFIPLRNKIQSILDHTFFHGTQQELVQENQLLRQELVQTERLKSVATLASGLAHEIKNPLTAIKTFTEYLPQKMDDKKFLTDFSRIVGGEVNRINNLVNQLMDFAKPAPLQLKNTDVNQLLRDLLNFLNSKFLKHNIRVNENLNDSLPLIPADPNQLKQAFLNILLNAAEAMAKGGTLSVSTEQTQDTGHKTQDSNRATQNVRPESETSLKRRAVRITVKDCGHGISPADLPHIVDPFFSKKDSGTGLGLAVTHAIIQQHGGKISVESRVGEGTEVVVEMPAID